MPALELFDMEMYMQHGILTSRGIQRRYLMAVKERARMRRTRGSAVKVHAAFWLIDREETRKGFVELDDEEPVPVAACSEHVPNSTDKVKDSKGQDSKEQNRIQNQRTVQDRTEKDSAMEAVSFSAPSAESCPSFGRPSVPDDFSFSIPEDELNALRRQYGEEAVAYKLPRLMEWVRSSGQVVRSPAGLLRSWLRQDAPAAAACSVPSSAPFKRTSAHNYTQRVYSDEFLDSLSADIDTLNSP